MMLDAINNFMWRFGVVLSFTFVGVGVVLSLVGVVLAALILYGSDGTLSDRLLGGGLAFVAAEVAAGVCWLLGRGSRFLFSAE